ncbi:hypothetical protein L9F63_028125, partial [Diploptera punctata]
VKRNSEIYNFPHCSSHTLSLWRLHVTFRVRLLSVIIVFFSMQFNLLFTGNLFPYNKGVSMKKKCIDNHQLQEIQTSFQA